ncbi:MAG: hypothetical protein IKC38_04820 [Clostridia bacterium]|nr:hypothetical protein [Clostridia bacterium]
MVKHYNKLRIMLIVELLTISLALGVLWAYLFWTQTSINLSGATLVYSDIFGTLGG